MWIKNLTLLNYDFRNQNFETLKTQSFFWNIWISLTKLNNFRNCLIQSQNQQMNMIWQYKLDLLMFCMFIDLWLNNGNSLKHLKKEFMIVKFQLRVSRYWNRFFFQRNNLSNQNFIDKALQSAIKCHKILKSATNCH